MPAFGPNKSALVVRVVSVDVSIISAFGHADAAWAEPTISNKLVVPLVFVLNFIFKTILPNSNVWASELGVISINGIIKFCVVKLLNTCDLLDVPISTNRSGSELLIIGKIRMEASEKIQSKFNSN